MTDIINYKLKTFLRKDTELIQNYITLLSHLVPVPVKKEVFYMKLKKVQDIKELVADGTLMSLIKVVQMTDKVSDEDILEMKILDFFPRVNDVIRQLKEIRHAEEVSLQSKHSSFKWEAVNGSERMSKFGIYNTLDNLAKGKIWKYKKILNLSYADVFTKLYMDTVKGDLDNEMNTIKTR